MERYFALNPPWWADERLESVGQSASRRPRGGETCVRCKKRRVKKGSRRCSICLTAVKQIGRRIKTRKASRRKARMAAGGGPPRSASGRFLKRNPPKKKKSKRTATVAARSPKKKKKSGSSSRRSSRMARRRRRTPARNAKGRFVKGGGGSKRRRRKSSSGGKRRSGRRRRRASAKTVVVVSNPRRRRRRRSRVSNPRGRRGRGIARDSRGRYLKKGRSSGRRSGRSRKPRMRTKGVYRPSFRVGRRSSMAVRKRLWAGGWARKAGRRYVLNPRRRRRRNPGSGGGRGIIANVKRNVGQLLKISNYVEAAQVGILGLGLGGLVGPALIAKWTGKPQLNRGLLGAAMSGVSGAILAAAASAAGQHRLAAKLFAGSMIGATIKVAIHLVPSSMLNKLLPLGELRNGGGGAAAAAPAAMGYYGSGVGEWINPAAIAGMGDLITPEQLIAGEAFYGPRGVGDFMQINRGGVGEYLMFGAGATGLPNASGLELGGPSERF